MIEWLKYKLELHRLGKLSEKYSRKAAVAEDREIKRGYDDGELSNISQESDNLENMIKLYQSQHYTRICQKLALPMPEAFNNEYYYKFNFDDNMGDRLILTPSGFYHVRNLIYEERKRKRDIYGFWVAILIGFIGALTGLVAVFKN